MYPVQQPFRIMVRPLNPRRLLVFRFGQLGDTITALPALWTLREQFPAAHLALLSEVPSHGTHLPPDAVLPKEGLLDDFLRYQGGVSWNRALDYAGRLWNLRRQRFDTLAYLVPSTRTVRQRQRDAAFFRLAGIGRLLGFHGFPADASPRGADGLPMPVEHEADALMRRLAVDGVTVPGAGQGCMDLRITEAERARVLAWWAGHAEGAIPKQRWVAVCPGTKWPSKQWPVERYLALGKKLWTEHGLLPVVLGGPEDRGIAAHLIAGWGAGRCAAGELSVRESAALLEGAAFYVGNDTGTMHLAAAVKTPCVGVFSAQDWPERWHPYGDSHRVLRVSVPCSGCRLPICDRELQCLTSIGVEEVYAACVAALADAGLLSGSKD